MDSLSKSILKSVKSLGDSKARRASGLFKVEGSKCVLDTLGSFECRHLFATRAWADSHPDIGNVVICKSADIERMSSLSTPSDVIAVYAIPERYFDPDEATRNLVLALDTIQDPGNLGTIVRIADWFGIRHIICTRETADIYNPKTVQSSMGAISRVSVTYFDDLATALTRMKSGGVKIYGTFLGGDNIFTTELSHTGVIVIGNEGKGISDDVAQIVDKRLTIPSYPIGVATSESLNAAVATAITVAEFRKKTYGKKN